MEIDIRRKHMKKLLQKLLGTNNQGLRYLSATETSNGNANGNVLQQHYQKRKRGRH